MRERAHRAAGRVRGRYVFREDHTVLYYWREDLLAPSRMNALEVIQAAVGPNWLTRDGDRVQWKHLPGLTEEAHLSARSRHGYGRSIPSSELGSGSVI